MFRIGEFAQIAQVSGRLLRYYDQIGLLSPIRIDPQTGYRWYSASQLPRLNRILALKELGLSLEQIAPHVDGDIGAEELRAILVERRDAAETARRLEDVRLKQIESRIAQIDAGSASDDVVMKSIPAMPYLATSCVCDDIDHATRVVGAIVEETVAKVSAALRDRLIVVSRSAEDDDRLNLDVGFSLTRESSKRLQLAGGMWLDVRELEPVATMATLVRAGPAWRSHSAFGAIGSWIEAHGFELVGACREVFLDPPFEGATEPIVEIQFPVQQAP